MTGTKQTIEGGTVVDTVVDVAPHRGATLKAGSDAVDMSDVRRNTRGDAIIGALEKSNAPGSQASTQVTFSELRNFVLSQAASESERRALLESLDQLKIRKVDGRSVLENESMGRSTLEHLGVLMRASLQPELAARRGELLKALVQELGAPDEQVNQGHYATCVVTTANIKLACDKPAEYARLVGSLATEGAVTTRGGASLQFISASASAEYLRGRSLAESIFQTAAGSYVGAYRAGLYTGQAEVVHEALFGEAFTRCDRSNMAAVVAAVRECAKGGVVMASVKWASAGVHCNHALALKDSDSQYVYFQNPWGKEYEMPAGVGAKLIDAKRQIYRMTIEEFQQRVNYVLANTAGSQFGITAGADDPANNVLTFIAPPEISTSTETSRGSRKKIEDLAQDDRWAKKKKSRLVQPLEEWETGNENSKR